MNHINEKVNEPGKYGVSYVGIINHFPFDEGQDSRTNLFKEQGDDVILDGLRLVSKMQSCIKEKPMEIWTPME